MVGCVMILMSGLAAAGWILTFVAAINGSDTTLFSGLCALVPTAFLVVWSAR